MKEVDFLKTGGLVPAIVQDANTNKVLMLGYMNEEALERTRSSGRVTFFSRSRQELWTKGETSGNFIDVYEVLVDCDNDTILVKGQPSGPVCHKGADTCFDEHNLPDGSVFLQHLEEVIADRHDQPKAGSYTTSLFQKGINKIAQKVGEEAVEVVIEAKDENDELFINETADLLFHLLVLLRAKDISLSSVMKTLKNRHQTS